MLEYVQTIIKHIAIDTSEKDGNTTNRKVVAVKEKINNKIDLCT